MAEEGAPTEETVTFIVKSSNDTKYNLTLPLSTTVADLKAKLAGSDYSDTPVERQRLIYSGRVLKDPDTLATHKVKEGHTIHLVKSAQSNQRQNPTNQGASTAPSTGTPTGGAAQGFPGVPTTFATGTGNNPLAGLTGARYAGFAQLPGAGMFGADGGMGAPPDPDEMIRLLRDPHYQQTLNEALQNPAMIDMMIQQNPMLRDMGPGIRQMLQSPEFRRMMTNPDAIEQQLRLQRAMGINPLTGMAGGAPSFPAPGATNTTETRDGATGDAATPTQPHTTVPPNPFQAFGNAGTNPFAGLFGAFPPTAPSQGTTEGGQNTNTAAPNNPFAALFDPALLAALQNPGQPQAQPQAQPPQGSNPSSPPPQNSQPAQPQQDQQQPNNPLFAAFANPQLFQQYLNLLNPQNQTQQPPTTTAGATGGQQQPPPQYTNPLVNPEALAQMIQALQGAGGPFGGLGGVGTTASPPPPADTRPPEERYESQLRQLNDMGFYDFDRNVEALRRSGGSVQGAVEYLLSH